MVGFQGTHHAVTPIDVEHDLVVVSRHSIIQNPGNSLLNIGAHLCQPGVQLPKQERIAYSTQDDRLVARHFRAFQFDRVCLCRVEAAGRHASLPRRPNRRSTPAASATCIGSAPPLPPIRELRLILSSPTYCAASSGLIPPSRSFAIKKSLSCSA